MKSYGYDPASRLTGLSYALGGTTLGDLAYSYDAGGRRQSQGGSWARTILPTPVSLNPNDYDAANRLLRWGTSTLSYDFSGNLTSDGTNTYTWNARGQLTAIGGGVTASFSYDALGRRRSKTIGGMTTEFVYDGLNLVQERQGGTATANLLNGGLDEVFLRTELSEDTPPRTLVPGLHLSVSRGRHGDSSSRLAIRSASNRHARRQLDER